MTTAAVDKRQKQLIGCTCSFGALRATEFPVLTHLGSLAEVHILGRMKPPGISNVRPGQRLDTRSLEALIVAAANGDHAAFAQIYERTHAHLFGVAIRILGQGQAAEDALQEAYVSIWKSAASYRSDIDGQIIQPMTWLIAIVRNKALDGFRVRARRKESALPESGDLPGDGSADGGHDDIDAIDGAAHAAPGPMQLLDQALHSLHIEACMQSLDGSHRQSLALAYYQGLSHSEVAAQMAAPLGSVKAWIRRGLEKLKNCLAARGVVA